MKVYSRTGLDNRTLTYDDFVCLALNVEDDTASENFNNAVSVAIGMGKGRIPRAWIDAAVEGQSGAAEWKNWDVFRLM